MNGVFWDTDSIITDDFYLEDWDATEGAKLHIFIDENHRNKIKFLEENMPAYLFIIKKNHSLSSPINHFFCWKLYSNSFLFYEPSEKWCEIESEDYQLIEVAEWVL